MVENFSNPSTGTVDYVAMRDSSQMGVFRAVASELGHPRLRSELLGLSENEKKACDAGGRGEADSDRENGGSDFRPGFTNPADLGKVVASLSEFRQRFRHFWPN